VQQTYRPLEVVIVNDGSTDDFNHYQSSYERILDEAGISYQILSQDNNGAAAARNRGLADSVGEYIICWDADTIAQPAMLDRLYEKLIAHSDASFCYCQFYFGFKKIKSYSFDPIKLRQVNYIDTTTLVRRDHMVPFDVTLKRFQDWDVWLTLLERGRSGVFLEEPLFKKIVRGRKGYSSWFPSFLLKFPWKSDRVRRYEQAYNVVKRKHDLT
jgi:glycosyltransferase involved in cell wall biosynthesis